MRAIAKKLHSRRGETLVEVLAAVLVCTLSVLLLASASMAAGNIDHTAADKDVTYYEALNHAEARDEAPEAGTRLTVTVDPGTSEAGTAPVPVTVSLYGDGDEGIYSFAAAASVPAPGPGEGGGGS